MPIADNTRIISASRSINNSDFRYVILFILIQSLRVTERPDLEVFWLVVECKRRVLCVTCCREARLQCVERLSTFQMELTRTEDPDK